MTELRATYRLQLGRRLRLRRRRARSCPTSPSSASRTSTCRPPSRPARARCTATTSSTRPHLGGARGRGGVPRADRRRARGGAGRDARHRPQPHGDRRRQPLLERPGAAREVLRHRSGDRPPPPLLRHRPPRGRAPGGPGGVRGDAPAGVVARPRGRSTACASTTPTGSPIRPATSSACATRGVEHVWVEKILDPGEKLRAWPVEGTVGYEFLNDAAALFVDLDGEAADRAVGRGLRRRAAVARPTEPVDERRFQPGLAASARMVACGVAVRSRRLPTATPVRFAPKSKARKVWKWRGRRAHGRQAHACPASGDSIHASRPSSDSALS